ncbi:MAG: WYL domain-containing protein, partial [Desulfovibrionales bacterium]
KNGKVILEFTARSRPEVVSWILGFGRHALLLKPTDLLEDLISVIEEMHGQYLGQKIFKEEETNGHDDGLSAVT